MVDDLEPFRWRLTETIAWCAPRADRSDPAGSLRSPALRPAMYEKNKTYPPFRLLLHDWWYKPRGSVAWRTAMATRLAEERARLLHTARQYPPRPSVDLAQGRLLCYAPDDQLNDATARADTEGFFEWEDAPPWDTWLFYGSDELAYKTDGRVWGDSYLLSWIPPQFVERVSVAISHNMTDCIYWADDLDSDFFRQLEAAGLLR